MAARRRGMVGTALLCFSLVMATGCGPKSVTEAEAKGNVKWLAERGSPDAVAALGRLADTKPAALEALNARGNDLQVYLTAWAAVERGAEWGPPLLKTALGDPERADTAATALHRADPRLVSFLPELEAAMVRLSPSTRAATIGAVIASAGAAGRLTVERRLADPKTRGAMCDGLRSDDSTSDAKSALLAVSPNLRDNRSCVNAVVSMARAHDNVLSWIATGAEPGLVSAVANGDMPCARVAAMFREAFTQRDRAGLGALSVPLGAALRRCTGTMDDVTADGLERAPNARPCILSAIDPFGGALAQMPKTCAALRSGWLRAESPLHRERAEDALSGGCRNAEVPQPPK